MWKFKSLKGRDKWLFLLTVGLILCILAFPMDKLTQKTSARRAMSSQAAENGVSEAGWQNESPVGEGEIVGGERDSKDETYPVSAKASEGYEQELERRVKEILKNVDGVGAVDVMIVLKSSSEKILHVDGSSSRSLTEEQDSSGGSRKIDTQEQGQSTVMASRNGESAPIIEKELKPELSGIVISAEGGGNPVVKAEISAAMEALFGLPAHKIKVLKRVE